MNVAAGQVPRGDQWSWRVFLICWLLYSGFWTPYLVREHFPAIAFAETGSLNLARYEGWTEDIFRGRSGGVYINNNPGASLTAAVPLFLFRPVLAAVDRWNRQLPRRDTPAVDGELFWRTQREGRAFYFLLIEFLTVAAVMAPVTAATAAYLCRRLIQAGVPPPGAAATALLCGLATPVFFRALYLNHNLLVADAGFIALLALWDPADRPLTLPRAAAAGLLAGYAVLCDYSGVVVVAVTAGYAWLRSAGWPAGSRARVVAAVAAGAVPGIAALVLYQAWAFGAGLLPAQHYMPATAPTVHGYRGFDWPSPSLIQANFFDPRFGLFAYCPFLALAFAAPFAERARYRVPRRETFVLLAYFGLFVIFCGANRYSWLQPSTGFRYLVPVVPGLALLAVQAAQVLSRPVRLAIGAASCVESLVLAAAHRNDIRESLGAVWARKGELLWMMRLRDAGVPVSWEWSCAALLLLAAACACVWLVPERRREPAASVQVIR